MRTWLMVASRRRLSVIALAIFYLFTEYLQGHSQNNVRATVSTAPVPTGENQGTRTPSPLPNYDETKIHQYTLPDPLLMLSGERVTTADQWYKFRRPELMRLFETYIYGRTPTDKPEMKCEQF